MATKRDKRTAEQVMQEHLRLRSAGELDRDLELNYHPEVVVMSARDVFRGHDGVRESAHLLWSAVSDGGDYEYESVLVDDRFALLEWRARTDEFAVNCGVDSYVIEDGVIVGQTIHYRVESLELSVAASALGDDERPGPRSDDDQNRQPGMVTTD
jgi:hypothetical protein